MRSLSVTLLLAAALTASACDSKTPDAKPDAKSDGKSDPAAAAKPEASPTPAEASPAAVVAEAEGQAPATGDTVKPAWFDAEKIPHLAIAREMASQGTVGAGGPATAMILELEAGVTVQQCIERATAALSADIGEVPEATEANGRLTIQGQTAGYSYTVVCGDANGKPSMYLAYNVIAP